MVPAPPSTSILGEGNTPAAPNRAAAAGERDDGGDWTLVQGRRKARRSSEVPQPARSTESSGEATASLGSRSPVQETAVMAALRRNAEDKIARDARRARLVERAREARESPGSEPTSETERGITGSAPPSPGGTSGSSVAPIHSPSPMGPPPPPRRPSVPPPPLPGRSQSGERPSRTPPSAPRSLEPPPAPTRPGKRTLPWKGSPSESGTPRSRHKPQSHSGGRSSSADGRLLQGDGSRPRIQFGDGAADF